MDGGFAVALKKIWPGIRNHQRLVLLGILGAGLLIVGGMWDAKESTPYNPRTENIVKNQSNTVTKTYEEALEAKLANMLSQVKGAGSVSVNITFDTGMIHEHEKNLVKETKTIQEKDSGGGIRTTTESRETSQVFVTKDGTGDHPVMVRENKPIIKGVLVIAEGANDSHVKENLVHAVQAGLGVPPYKISILPQRR